ncbi:MAG: hypothetical protein ABUK19_07775, partial [Desulfobacteria bacterium]
MDPGKAVLLDRQRWEEINSHFGTKAELMGEDPMNLSRGQDFLSLTGGLFTRESLPQGRTPALQGEEASLQIRNNR